MKLGKAESVNPLLGKQSALLLEKARRNDITTEISLEPFLKAPVAQGQWLGTLTVKAGDQVLSEIPLVAAEAVEKLSWLDLFRYCLGKAAMAKNV